MNEASPGSPPSPPGPPAGQAAPEDTGPGGRWARLGAALLDGLIGSLVVYAPLVAVGAPAVLMAIVHRQPFEVTSAIIAAGMVSGLLLVALLVVTIVLVARHGQTIGKRIVGVKVVRTDGSKAGIGRIFWLRNVVNALPSLVPLVGGLYGLVDILFIFSDSRRCLHDRIADTKVVRC